ncbi:hypothetical protein ACFLZ7_03330 [Nanoarchaeota archaeon]
MEMANNIAQYFGRDYQRTKEDFSKIKSNIAELVEGESGELDFHLGMAVSLGAIGTGLIATAIFGENGLIGSKALNYVFGATCYGLAIANIWKYKQN